MGTFPNIVKANHAKHMAYIIVKGEKLKSFSLKTGTSQECLLSPLLRIVVIESLTRAIRPKKLKGYN